MDVASDNPKEFTKLTPDEASLKAWADETLNEIYGDEEEEEAEDSSLRPRRVYLGGAV